LDIDQDILEGLRGEVVRCGSVMGSSFRRNSDGNNSNAVGRFFGSALKILSRKSERESERFIESNSFWGDSYVSTTVNPKII
jgi:hypothetical protein